jgi:hypothetical protein
VVDKNGLLIIYYTGVRMDILMKISEKTADIEDWNEEERIFWRSPKPINEPTWVYFVRNGRIIGKVRYVDYRYEKGENLQGRIQEGGAFVLKGPLIRPTKDILLPKEILRGSWRWRYVNDDVTTKINLDF